jgi:peptidoglycan-N-acetylglucosamine deacetylase
VQWNVTAFDWKETTAQKIFANVNKGIARNQRRGHGSNILLHDGGQAGIGQNRRPTVEATRLLLEKYRATTRFVTPDAWA